MRGGAAPSGVDLVDPVVFGGEAPGVLGVDTPDVGALGVGAPDVGADGVDALAGGGCDAVALELVACARCCDVPVRASQ